LKASNGISLLFIKLNLKSNIFSLWEMWRGKMEVGMVDAREEKWKWNDIGFNWDNGLLLEKELKIKLILVLVDFMGLMTIS